MHANDDSASLARHLPDEAATLALGGSLARGLVPGLKIWLEGDLGSGKTTLVRGALRGLGFEGHVRSPSFTVVELYAISRIDLYHFDFYRFNQPEEFLDAGLDEYFEGTGVCVVEWPDKALPYLPPADLRIRLEIADSGRNCSLVALTDSGRACLNSLRARLPASPAAGS